MLDKLIMEFRTRFLLALQTTGTGAQAYLAPTANAKSLIVRCLVTMGNAADLVLSLKYADDASGTNAAAFSAAGPLFINGVAQTAAKTATVSDSTGNFIVDFVVDPSLIPASKFVGVSYANSNAGNLLTAQLIENVANQPTAT